MTDLGKISKYRALINSFRLKFIPATITLLFMGIFWGLKKIPNLELVTIILIAFVALGLSNLLGLHINMISDYKLDKKYKTYLPNAIDTLGKRTIIYIFLIECIIAFVLVLYLTVMLEKILLLIMWLIGLFFAIAYSIEPLRFKSNPILNPISLMLVLCIFPMVWTYYLFASALTIPFIIFFCGISIGVIGLVIPTELEDYPEDKATGVHNLTQALGMKRSPQFAIFAAATSVTLAATGAGLAFIDTRHTWLWVPATIIMYVVHIYVICKLSNLKKICDKYEKATPSQKKELQIKIKKITHNASTWFGIVAWSGLFAGFLLYLSNIWI